MTSRRRTKRRRPTSDRGRKKKVCQFCRDKTKFIEYKDVGSIRKFVSDRGKIRARRTTGTCAKHQRALATAIKNAREMALLPYVQVRH